MENTYIIPKGPCLIVLVGPSGSGKSTFCETHFEDREVVSSDYLREWLTGDFQRQDKNPQVFDEFHRRIEVLLSAGQRAVADATHLRDGDRKRTAEVGYAMNVPVYYVVINRPLVGKMQTGGWRNSVRIKGKTLIEAHEETFNANLDKILRGDDQKWVTVVDTRQEGVEINVAKPLPRDRMQVVKHLADRGFKKLRVIADVHGNINGLLKVLPADESTYTLFLGDITDYGKQSWECVSIVNEMVSQGRASMVRGNHDKKMHKYITQMMANKEFSGQLTFGMDVSTNQLKAMIPQNATRVQMEFLSLVEQSPDWIEIDDWMFAHAAVDAKMFGNALFRSHANSKLESMALYGENDGTKDERGFPVRLYNWIDEMPSRKNAVLGHQIMSVEAPVMRRTNTGGTVIFLDTGSSKEIDGVGGFLSYLDFDIETKGGSRIAMNGFGGERDD